MIPVSHRWQPVFIGLLVISGCHSTSVYPKTDGQHPCLSAPDITETDNLIEGYLPAETESVYFRLHLTAQDPWVLLQTISNTGNTGDLDAVVSVLAPDGSRVLASVDDHFLYAGETDPAFMFHAPSPGTYCVQVQSFRSWIGAPLYGNGRGPAYAFAATLMPEWMTWGSGSPDVDAEINFRFVEETSGPRETWINGVLAETTGADGFVFPCNGEALQVYADMAFGSGDPGQIRSGSGTSAIVSVRLESAAGEILAKVDLRSVYHRLMTLTPADESCRLVVTRAPNHPPGDNDFYSLLVYSAHLTEAFFEPLNDNDTLQTAAEIPFVESPAYRTRTVHGFVDPEDDVDTWWFTATAEETLEMLCSGRTLGSGLDAFTLRLRNSSGDVLREDVETDNPILWSTLFESSMPPYSFPSTGTYYLQMTATPLQNVASRLYSCNIVIY